MSRRFAIIENGKVVNTIVAASWPNAIDITDRPEVGIGWSHDGSNFIEPASVPDELAADRRITNLAFRKRFTQLELRQLKIIAAINPAAPVEEQQLSADIAVYDDLLRDAKYIDLNDPRTNEDLQGLVFLGVLTSERAAEILNAPILDNERL